LIYAGFPRAASPFRIGRPPFKSRRGYFKILVHFMAGDASHSIRLPPAKHIPVEGKARGRSRPRLIPRQSAHTRFAAGFMRRHRTKPKRRQFSGYFATLMTDFTISALL
jgi:hypothetical protein